MKAKPIKKTTTQSSKKSTEYRELLKDPRWQKMRLEILERDDWACQSCFDTESTLHVHHCYYSKENLPWEYESESLVTLCENCHERETLVLSEARKNLTQAIGRRGGRADDIDELASSISDFRMIKSPVSTLEVMAWAWRNEEVQRLLHDLYFASKCTWIKGAALKKAIEAVASDMEE